MRNFIWSFMTFFCFNATSFSQSNNDTGSYLSNNKGRNLKLNLLVDNKYEFFMGFGNSEVKFSGDYEIKGDSLQFPYTPEKKSFFNLICKNDKKSKKIKISFIDRPDNPVFIGTQKGSETIEYNDISNFQDQSEEDDINKKLVFEIDRVDYLYLICENPDKESKFSKFALPKDVSEIIINYELDFFADLKASGFFDRKSNLLIIDGKSKKDPIVFINAKNVTVDNAVKVIPVENKIVLNWTYPGKELLESEESEAESYIDSAQARVDPPKIDFKLKISNNLKSAIAATKEVKNKFLVVVDTKKTSSKDTFNDFIKNQEEQLSYNMYDEYDSTYDVFNYYQTSVEDEVWIKNNKVKNNANVFVLNGNGDLLGFGEFDLANQKDLFRYSGKLYKKLLQQDAFLSVDKIIKNKKESEVNLIKALNRASVLELYYHYIDDASSHDDSYEFVTFFEESFKTSKRSLNSKELSKTWKKLIESHQKDTTPNMYLTETILREINGEGFFKQFFDEDRILNDTDFLSIDYLLKHCDVIEENLEFNNKKEENYNNDKIISQSLINHPEIISENREKFLKYNKNVIAEITAALNHYEYISDSEIWKKTNQEKTIAVYKKIIDAGKGSFEIYKKYFEYIRRRLDNEDLNKSFLNEFSNYFDSNLVSEKACPIDILDKMYSSSESFINTESAAYSNSWSWFKEYHSDLCNNLAWQVVLKSQNKDFIKSAIRWSEYSLIITKNNPYYLDTLAQLYYKDGQKQKAIVTQELAVKYFKSDNIKESENEMVETLEKMKNGTY